MTTRTRGLLLVAGGALLALLALAADPLGLGAHPDFGWKQLVGTVVGVGIAVLALRDLRS